MVVGGVQPLIKQYDDTCDDTVLFAEHRERSTQDRKRPATAPRREHRSKNSYRHEQLGTTDQARDRLDMQRMPGEDQPGSDGRKGWQPARDNQDEQHRGETVPQRVHDVEPARPPAGDRPIERVRKNRDGTVQTGARLARPIGLIERRERGADRMRGGVRHDHAAVVLDETVAGGRQVQGDRGDEDDQQLAFHGMRASRESATAESPRERAANACVR